MRGDDVLFINDNGTVEAIRYGGGELAELERHEIHGDHHEFKKTAYAVNKNSDNTFTVIFKIEDKNSIWNNDTQSRSWNTNVTCEIQQPVTYTHIRSHDTGRNIVFSLHL